MGNHQAGRAMGLTAKALLSTRTNQTSIELLDIVCEPYRGCDAEFEGQQGDKFVRYTDPDGPIGELIVEAFGGGLDWIGKLKANTDLDVFFDEWWVGMDDGPYGKFRKRYDFR